VGRMKTEASQDWPYGCLRDARGGPWRANARTDADALAVSEGVMGARAQPRDNSSCPRGEGRGGGRAAWRASAMSAGEVTARRTRIGPWQRWQAETSIRKTRESRLIEDSRCGARSSSCLSSVGLVMAASSSWPCGQTATAAWARCSWPPAWGRCERAERAGGQERRNTERCGHPAEAPTHIAEPRSARGSSGHRWLQFGRAA